MRAAGDFRQCLEAGDLDGVLACLAAQFPGATRPATREQGEFVMHRARTETASISLAARAWSHRWLCERGLPSGLPDDLKPKAERLYPRVVEAVGIALVARSPRMQPALDIVRGDMEAAVLDAYAENRKDPAFVSARMAEVKAKSLKRLFG